MRNASVANLYCEIIRNKFFLFYSQNGRYLAKIFPLKILLKCIENKKENEATKKISTEENSPKNLVKNTPIVLKLQDQIKKFSTKFFTKLVNERNKLVSNLLQKAYINNANKTGIPNKITETFIEPTKPIHKIVTKLNKLKKQIKIEDETKILSIRDLIDKRRFSDSNKNSNLQSIDKKREIMSKYGKWYIKPSSSKKSISLNKNNNKTTVT